MSMTDEDWRVERAYEQAERNTQRCQCGYPDWPGRCPGAANCPCCDVGQEETDDAE